MLPDSQSPVSPQPALFQVDESQLSIELIPEVWTALNDLTKPDIDLRLSALERLVTLNAPRNSAVVAYFLVTRITDQNLDLRAWIVEILGELLNSQTNGSDTPTEVRSSLHLFLSGFRTRQIYAILQVSAEYPSHEPHVVRLLNSCPYAGNHLLDILKDRKTPVEVRKQAVLMIGKVGYLYTIPDLERLVGRLETRLNGQKAMYFAPQVNPTEVDLLPHIQKALNQLRAP